MPSPSPAGWGWPTTIVTQAEALVSPQSLEAEAMLAEIKRAREAALTAEAEAKAAQRRVETRSADLSYRLAKVEEARREVLAEARAQAQAELEAVQFEAARLRDQLDAIPRERGPTHGQEPARKMAGGSGRAAGPPIGAGETAALHADS